MREAGKSNVADAPVTVRKVCTDNWPERDRLAMFRANVGRDRVSVEPLPDEPLRINATFIKLPGVGLVFGRRSALRSDFGDASDRLLINFDEEGLAKQFGREVRLKRGDAIVFAGGDVGSHTTFHSARLVTVEFPEGGLTRTLRDPARFCARSIDGRTPALLLLRRYLGGLRTSGTIDARSLHPLVAAHVLDLSAFAVGAGCESAAASNGRGIRAARLQAIKDDILAQLEGELSLDNVAARHCVTARYVRMLFESEGMNFSEFVREERLKRARRMLLSRSFDHLLISEIAYEVGFNDLSYFNRSFRRRFEMAPGEMRALGVRST